MTEALYIHIPFCDHICNYCDFPKLLLNYSNPSSYIDVLIAEIEGLNIKDDSLKTIYIGGGTPSSLSVEQLKKLLSYLKRRFNHLEEFTMEANPESLTAEKLSIMKSYGVSRLSLGVQSSFDTTLKKLGRKHTSKDVQECVKRIRDSGFTNLNLDFIYGLEGTSIQDLKRDIDFALSLKPQHLSFYSLQIEPNTVFSSKKISSLSDDELADEYQFLCHELSRAGFNHYEVSNFALPSYESKHNLTYWHDEEYYACGLGASSYVDKVRRQNTLSMSRYMNREFIASEEKISPKDEEFEFIMLAFRLQEGISLKRYKERFHADFKSKYHSSLIKEKDFLIIDDEHVAVKPDYFYIIDSIFLNLI